jgi:hypothetical protein
MARTDGLKGLAEAVANVWPLTTVQTCIIHLIRNTFRLGSCDGGSGSSRHGWTCELKPRSRRIDSRMWNAVLAV